MGCHEKCFPVCLGKDFSSHGVQRGKLSGGGERHRHREGAPTDEAGFSCNGAEGASWEVPSKERKGPINSSYLNKKKKRWTR